MVMIIVLTVLMAVLLLLICPVTYGALRRARLNCKLTSLHVPSYVVEGYERQSSKAGAEVYLYDKHIKDVRPDKLRKAYQITRQLRRLEDESYYDDYKKFAVVAAIVVGVIEVIVAIATSFYAQDPGEAVVVRSFTGNIVAQTETAGLHAKAPWDSAISFNTRNNIISFSSANDKAKYGYNQKENKYTGTFISVNDNKGVKAEVDLQVNYSLEPKATKEIYTSYKDQETYVTNYLSLRVAEAPKVVASSKFDTLQLLTERDKFAQAIEERLKVEGSDNGVIISQVTVQDIRYSDTISNTYADAQKSEIEKQKAQNQQEIAKTEAETKRITAQGDADANKILDQSLTPNVLEQKRIDAYRNAKELYLVPEGSSTLIQPSK